MPHIEKKESGEDFLKSLGFPTITVHDTFTHFDFLSPGRRVLLIGPMGSGKTEFAARVWRDAAIAQKKSERVRAMTSTGMLDRRKVFFIRSEIDSSRFQDYPDDEEVLKDNPEVGTYIIDEASFFDERLAYVVRNYSMEKGCMFIFPTLILNFRKDIFNSTARLMLDIATDVIPLTAYCEHPDCMDSAFYTYRYYQVEGKECPALYFDPLIVVGGDKIKDGSLEPNYASRCDRHHFLPAKEYTFFTLKPLGEEAGKGNAEPLYKEIRALNEDKEHSELYRNLMLRYDSDPDGEIYTNAIIPNHIAEKALCYLFSEQNMIGETLLLKMAKDLELDTAYMSKTLSDNRHPVSFEQGSLL